MKVLQLCHRVPYPLRDGGNIAMYQIGKSLTEKNHSLKILALNTRKHYVDPETLPPYLKNDCKLETIDIDTSINPIEALVNLFQSESYNIRRFHSSDFENKLVEVLKTESFDIIQPESLFMTTYIDVIRKHSKAKVIMRAHNVEHIIWERLAEKEPAALRKYYLGLLAKRLKTYEIAILKKLDGILAITGEDKKLFASMSFGGPQEVIPLGIDVEANPVNPGAFSQISLFHLGSMDWMPNIEAVEWFLEKCWPAIRLKYPDLNLFLAGRGFPEEISSRKLSNVHFTGEVSNASAYMKDKPVMIVPLLSGSGLRIKIIQGMAAGKVIIATTIGAEGIEYTDKKNILIADTPEQFLEAVTFCMEQMNKLPAIAASAQMLVQEKYSSASVGNRLDEFYRSLL